MYISSREKYFNVVRAFLEKMSSVEVILRCLVYICTLKKSIFLEWFGCAFETFNSRLAFFIAIIRLLKYRLTFVNACVHE